MLRFYQFKSLSAAGHGAKLYRIIYEYGLGPDVDMHELTVEQPAPQFRRLRDRCDIQTVLQKHAFDHLLPLQKYRNSLKQDNNIEDEFSKSRESLPLSLEPSEASAAQTTLRMTLSQIHRCFEALAWLCIRHDDQLVNMHRLSMKRRRLKEDSELRCIQDLSVRKHILSEYYETDMEEYKSALKALRLI